MISLSPREMARWRAKGVIALGEDESKRARSSFPGKS
jgi:hypothetical protein